MLKYFANKENQKKSVLPIFGKYRQQD